MRANLRAKARPAFASLRGWASPIGSGAKLGLLCAVDCRAPGRGRGLGGEPRMLSARAIACALGLNLVKPNWFSGERASGPRWARSWRRGICARPPGLPAARPKASKRQTCGGARLGSPGWNPCRPERLPRCAPNAQIVPGSSSTDQSGQKPVLRPSGCVGHESRSDGGGGRRLARAGRRGWATGGVQFLPLSTPFAVGRDGLGRALRSLSTEALDRRNAFRFDAPPPDVGGRVNRIGQGGGGGKMGSGSAEADAKAAFQNAAWESNGRAALNSAALPRFCFNFGLGARCGAAPSAF